MTQPTHIRGEHLPTALSLAACRVPVLPLRAGKVPFGNCRACARQRVRRPAEHEDPRPLHLPGPVPRLGRRHHRPRRHQLARLGAGVARGGGGGLPPRRRGPDRPGPRQHGSHHVGARQPARHPDRAHHPGRALALPGRHALRQRGAARRGHQVVHVLRAVARPRHRHPHGPAGRRPGPAGARARPGPPGDRAGAGWGRAVPAPQPAYLERGIAMAEQSITAASSAVHATVYRGVPGGAVHARPVRLPHRGAHRPVVRRRAGQGRDGPALHRRVGQRPCHRLGM